MPQSAADLYEKIGPPGVDGSFWVGIQSLPQLGQRARYNNVTHAIFSSFILTAFLTAGLPSFPS